MVYSQHMGLVTFTGFTKEVFGFVKTVQSRKGLTLGDGDCRGSRRLKEEGRLRPDG